MASLAVTVKGQVTLKRDLLQHLGIQPGERVDFEKLPGGELRIRAAKPSGTIDGFLGLLAGKTKKRATIEEMNEAAEQAATGPARDRDALKEAIRLAVRRVATDWTGKKPITDVLIVDI